METVQVEIWVMVSESGEYEVSKDSADLQPGPGEVSRMVKVTLTVPLPRPVELVGAVPAESVEGGELRVA